MKKLEAVPFSSPELREAFDRVSGAASNLGSKLDAISNDIKTLESSLCDLGVIEPVRVKFGEMTEWVGSAQMTWEERVLWGKGDNGRFRLFYEVWNTEDWTPHGDSRGSVTPLIECKKEIRIRAHKVLPALLLKVGGHIDPDLTPSSVKREPAAEGDER